MNGNDALESCISCGGETYFPNENQCILCRQHDEFDQEKQALIDLRNSNSDMLRIANKLVSTAPTMREISIFDTGFSNMSVIAANETVAEILREQRKLPAVSIGSYDAFFGRIPVIHPGIFSMFAAHLERVNSLLSKRINICSEKLVLLDKSRAQ